MAPGDHGWSSFTEFGQWPCTGATTQAPSGQGIGRQAGAVQGASGQGTRGQGAAGRKRPPTTKKKDEQVLIYLNYNLCLIFYYLQFMGQLFVF